MVLRYRYCATDNVRTGILDVAGVGTFRNDVNIPDKIIHLGDTNTAIRFPAAIQLRQKQVVVKDFALTQVAITFRNYN